MKMVNLRRPPAGVNLQGASFIGGMADVNDHVARVAAGGGTGANELDLFKIYRFLHSHGLLSGTKLLWTPEAGYVHRVDGVLKYCRTGFDTSLYDNDLDGSATASQQPRLVGGIAPNSKPAAANLNGEARYFTHPAISFGAMDAWSLSVMINNMGINAGAMSPRILGKSGSDTATLLYLNAISNIGKLGFRNQTPGNIATTTNTYYQLNGKYNLLTLVAEGNSTLKIYVNGIFIETLSIATNATFDTFNNAGIAPSVDNTLKVLYKAYHIQSGAMSAAQVLAEYNLLRAMYPEIESVVIDTQTWATRNFEAVATPMGNVIAEMQAATAVEKLTQPVNLTNWTSALSTIIDSNNFTTTSVGGVLKNIGLKANTYYKIIITHTSSSNLVLRTSTSIVNAISLGTSNTSSTFYYKSPDAGSAYLVVLSAATVNITSLSIQELGWSNATEIYDAVYAATSGTTAQKEYAALKEAAMWCYYNNDPANGAIYGKLYNWYAAKLLDLDMQTAGFGWRVPTSAQFTTLATYLGGTSVAGGKMKMTGTDYWNTPNTGATNESGFTALGGGYRVSSGSFSLLKSRLFLMTNTTSIKYLRDDSAELLDTSVTTHGGSIRLIKE